MPLSAIRLADEKAIFLARFGLTPLQTGWQGVAYRDAMASSARRGRLYRSGLTDAQRSAVKQGWQAELVRLAATYASGGSITRAQYENDVYRLKRHMNANFAGCFHQQAVGIYQPGFRVAHAQKSLSLVLKHYWCHGALPEPPCCPVDRRILRHAGAPLRDQRWTDMNSIAQLNAKLAILTNASIASPFAPISLAEWELEAFN